MLPLSSSCRCRKTVGAVQEKVAELEAQVQEVRRHLAREQELRQKTETENQFLMQAGPSATCEA